MVPDPAPNAPASLTDPGPALSAEELEVLRRAMADHARGAVPAAGQGYFSLLQRHPAHPRLQFQMGRLALMANRFDQAEFHFRRALQAAPAWVEPMSELAMALDLLGREAEALALFEEATALAPLDPALWIRKATTLRNLNRIEESAAATGRALDLDPTRREALLQRALLLQDQGRLEEADLAFERARSAHPEDPYVRYQWACTLLGRGRWEEGWAEYESRRGGVANPAFPMLDFAPEWDGRIRPGLRLLVRLEQGLGDTFQFIRYVARLLEEGVQVVLQRPQGSQNPLLGLLAAQGWPVAITGPQEPPGAVDAQTWLLSLPLRTGWRPRDLPRTPYLRVPAAAQEAWRSRLAEAAGFKVGLVWLGNRLHWDDHRRSPGLAALLRAVQGLPVQLVSLQKERAEGGVGAVALHDWMGEVQDFTDTAAIVAGLDAVVSIDSSVAHLAGALDRPVCLLLPEPAEWRWLRGVDRTEWYPRHRLLRQARPGDWTEPLRQLREELSRALAGRPRTP